MAADLLGDLRPRAAVDAHGVELTLGGSWLAGRQIERRTIGRKLYIGHFVFALCELPGLAAVRGDAVNMHVSALFAAEVKLFAVLQPANAVRGEIVDPGVVVFGENRLGFRRSEVDRKDPTILVVGGPGDHHGARTLIVEQGLV